VRSVFLEIPNPILFVPFKLPKPTFHDHEAGGIGMINLEASIAECAIGR